MKFLIVENNIVLNCEKIDSIYYDNGYLGFVVSGETFEHNICAPDGYYYHYNDELAFEKILIERLILALSSVFQSIDVSFIVMACANEAIEKGHMKMEKHGERFSTRDKHLNELKKEIDQKICTISMLLSEDDESGYPVLYAMREIIKGRL